jgi:hypothetical protein
LTRQRFQHHRCEQLAAARKFKLERKTLWRWKAAVLEGKAAKAEAHCVNVVLSEARVTVAKSKVTLSVEELNPIEELQRRSQTMQLVPEAEEHFPLRWKSVEESPQWMSSSARKYATAAAAATATNDTTGHDHHQ